MKNIILKIIRFLYLVAVIIFLDSFSIQLFGHSLPPDSTYLEDSVKSLHDNLIEKDDITGIWDVSPVKPLKDIAVTGVNDTWALLKSPFEWDSTSFLLFPSIALTTYFLMILDEPITYRLLGDKKYANSKVFEYAEYYGRNLTTEISAAGFTLAGLVSNEEELIQIGLEIYESYYFANNIHSVVKRAFGRARPNENKGTTYFDPFPDRKNPKNAFPSGHATISFSLSTVLASHLDNTYLKILAFTPAVLTCFSRVYQNYHWTSDVFLGAAIGYLVGTFVTNRHKVEGQNFFTFGVDEQGRFSLIVPLK